MNIHDVSLGQKLKVKDFTRTDEAYGSVFTLSVGDTFVVHDYSVDAPYVVPECDTHLSIHPDDLAPVQPPVTCTLHISPL